LELHRWRYFWRQDWSQSDSWSTRLGMSNLRFGSQDSGR
jgi:hypothetical protein